MVEECCYLIKHMNRWREKREAERLFEADYSLDREVSLISGVILKQCG